MTTATEELTLGQQYGPYRVLKGRHIEDVARLRVRVMKVSGPTFTCETIVSTLDRFEIGKQERFITTQAGGDWSCKAQVFNTYLDGRRVVPDEIKPGDEITLCQPVTYRASRNGPSDLFLSNCELDVRFNTHGSIKFERANPAETGELDALKAENESLKAALASQPPRSFLEDIKALNLKELRKVAAEEEIDISGCTTREQIIDLFKARDYR